MKEILSIEETNLLLAFFRESIVSEILWEEKVDFCVEHIFEPHYKIDLSSVKISNLEEANYQMPSWQLGDRSKFGKREKLLSSFSNLMRRLLFLN